MSSMKENGLEFMLEIQTVTTARWRSQKNTGNAYDGWGLYHEFDFLYLPGKPGTLSIPPGNITATGFNVTWDIETDTLPSAPSDNTYEYTYKVTYSTTSNLLWNNK